jgi:hypothetical protein
MRFKERWLPMRRVFVLLVSSTFSSNRNRKEKIAHLSGLVRGNCTPAASGYARGIYGAAETLVNDPVVSIETTRGYVHIHGSDDVAVVVHLPASASS